MSFTYEYIYITGFSSGADPGTPASYTGVQINKPLYYRVSGLKYDGTGMTYEYTPYFTGRAVMGSGNIIIWPSGNLIYSSDDQYWEGTVINSNSDDNTKYATGFINLWWNSGSSTQTGIESTGMEFFANYEANTWNILTNADGIIQNADLHHSHTGLVSPGFTGLDDLIDVTDVAYDNGKVLRANGTIFQAVYLTGSDIPLYDAMSGSLRDISGQFSGVSGDFSNVSGDFIGLSGFFTGLSGSYLTTSGSYISLSGLFTGAVSGNLKALSGLFTGVSGNFVLISGSYISLSGIWSNASGSDLWYLKDLSGNYRATSGALNTRFSDYDFSTAWATDSTHSASKRALYYAITSFSGVSGSMEVGVNTGGYAELYSTKILTGLYFRTLTGDQYISVTQNDAHIAIGLQGEPGVSHISGLTGYENVIHYSTGTVMTGLALGTSGLVLTSTGPDTAPVWNSGGESTIKHITGLTGNSWQVFYSSGAKVTGLALGTSGLVLTSTGPGSAPVWNSGGEEDDVDWYTGITTSQAWKLKTKGDTDDFIEFDTKSNIPCIIVSGGTTLQLDAEGTNQVYLKLAGVGGPGYLNLIADKDTKWGQIQTTGSLYLDSIGGTIYFRYNSTDVAILSSSAFYPNTTLGPDLGTSSKYWDNLYIQNIYTTGGSSMTLTGSLLQLGNQTISGHIYCSGNVYGAVYNDYADAWPIASGVDKIPGCAYSLNDSGFLILTNKRSDKRYFGIYTDTFGTCLGMHRSEDSKIPLSVAGYVKARVDKTYSPTTYLTTTISGRLTKAKFWEKKIAQYIRKDKNERSWVKIL